MQNTRRWDPCISHDTDEVKSFIEEYFSAATRKVLLVAGAGFDPRSVEIPSLLASHCSSLRAAFVREHRPSPPQALLERAERNATTLHSIIPSYQTLDVEIFGSDGAVVGGRNVVSLFAEIDVSDITDFVVDISALSVGTSFPLVRYMVGMALKAGANLHLFVTHNPALDAQIRSIASDSPGYVHGFRGTSSLDAMASAAKLWLPQLAEHSRAVLNRLYDYVEPHDTCPILPFPAHDPRLGDRLAEAFLTEFESTWTVDTRNIVYTDEDDPLDLYRTILRLDDRRQPVFQETGGSLLVLSPVGSKVMALGAFMAALERDLPVAYLEAIGYHLDESIPIQAATPRLIHIWLEGEVYPQPRPPLSA